MIKIIDKPSGYGKTVEAIQLMSEMIDERKKFIYVTPFLSETERITQEVTSTLLPNPVVKQPLNGVYSIKGVKTKTEHLITLLQCNESVAITHQLLLQINANHSHLFEGYHLILDEVINPLRYLEISPDEIELLRSTNQISVNDIGAVDWSNTSFEANRLRDIKEVILTGNTYLISEKFLVWMFPYKIFEAFESVRILTYMYRSSLLSGYLTYHSADFEVESLSYEDHIAYRNRMNLLIDNYEDESNNFKLRRLRKGHDPITDSSYSKNHLCKLRLEEVRKISKGVTNFLQKYQYKADQCAFTTFKDVYGKANWKGFKRGFIPINERATNQYSEKKIMIYLGNRYLPPHIKEFFRTKNILFNEDMWAASELLQWLFRGRIRDNQDILTYIPSYRMRNLLENWIDGKDLVKPLSEEDFPHLVFD